MDYGIVYVLTNPCMPGMVKIGMTERDEIDARLKELYTTAVPLPFDCKYACKVKKLECSKIEKALHTAFAPQRVNANREFFRIAPEQAIAILELFNHEDITEEVKTEIENDLSPTYVFPLKASKNAKNLLLSDSVTLKYTISYVVVSSPTTSPLVTFCVVT